MPEPSEALDALRRRIAQEQKLYASPLIQVGDFTYGQPKVFSWGEGTVLKIGKFCSIAKGVTIFLGGEHRPDWVTTYPFNALMSEFAYLKGHPKSKGDVAIGNDVWLGSCATILSGVSIGDGAVVGANATVTKDVPPYAVAAGNPAKWIRYRFAPNIIEKLLTAAWWNWDDANLFHAIPLLQSGDLEALLHYYAEKVAPHKN